MLKYGFHLLEFKQPGFLVEGRGQTHELSVDTPQVADSFARAGPTESRVGRVSHRLWPAAKRVFRGEVRGLRTGSRF